MEFEILLSYWAHLPPHPGPISPRYSPWASLGFKLTSGGPTAFADLVVGVQPRPSLLKFVRGARMLVCPTNFVIQVVMSAEEARIVQSATISVSEERQACK